MAGKKRKLYLKDNMVKILLLIIVIWLLWTGIEAIHSLDMPMGDFQRGFTQGGIVGGTIGGVIGIFVAYRIYKKIQNTNDDIINQMSEFITEEKD